ncbi:proline-rich protein 36-like isoform X2 [Daktulosphaira vitifoliae]|uniref:proline-rich protein 36-like isoform X2 n=1 Tax=Daktulosphaira vitifoliae TaxID=58002 RepID=UPI0021AAB21D|nr:proline-rich protein 36-like isoform X2 [Daktulosphaira vitifoliae]
MKFFFTVLVLAVFAETRAFLYPNQPYDLSCPSGSNSVKNNNPSVEQTLLPTKVTAKILSFPKINKKSSLTPILLKVLSNVLQEKVCDSNPGLEHYQPPLQNYVQPGYSNYITTPPPLQNYVQPGYSNYLITPPPLHNCMQPCYSKYLVTPPPVYNPFTVPECDIGTPVHETKTECKTNPIDVAESLVSQQLSSENLYFLYSLLVTNPDILQKLQLLANAYQCNKQM